MEFLKRLETRKHYISVTSHVRASPHFRFICVLYILVVLRSKVIRSSLTFLLPISMLAIFGTPHKSNVLLTNFLVYVYQHLYSFDNGFYNTWSNCCVRDVAHLV